MRVPLCPAVHGHIADSVRDHEPGRMVGSLWARKRRQRFTEPLAPGAVIIRLLVTGLQVRRCPDLAHACPRNPTARHRILVKPRHRHQSRLSTPGIRPHPLRCRRAAVLTSAAWPRIGTGTQLCRCLTHLPYTYRWWTCRVPRRSAYATEADQISAPAAHSRPKISPGLKIRAAANRTLPRWWLSRRRPWEYRRAGNWGRRSSCLADDGGRPLDWLPAVAGDSGSGASTAQLDGRSRRRSHDPAAPNARATMTALG